MTSKNPDIRCKGFTDAWEQRKLKNISERVKGNDGRMDIPTLTISAGSGWLDQRERFSANIAGKEQRNYTLLSKGELSYNHGNSKLAKYGVVFKLRNFEEALVPKVYHSFRMKDTASANFIEYMFATKKPDRELAKLISSGARMDGLLNIGYEAFMGIKVNIPIVEEQMKIGKLFRCLDETIALHQHELTLLKQRKKAFLQKMFPEKGEETPELRFKSFTEKWNRKLIGDLMTVTSVKRIHQSDWSLSGVRFLRARDLVSKYKNKRPEDYLYISREKYEEFSSVSGKVKIGDLLVTGVGTIGIPMQITNNEPLYFKDGNIIWLKNNRSVDGNFLYYSFCGNIIQQYIQNVAGTGTVGTYTINSGKKTPIVYPTLEEQTKIGIFFKELDKSISLQEQKLESLKQMKKAFLQKMFV